MNLKKFFQNAYSNQYSKAKTIKDFWSKFEKPYLRYFLFGSLSVFIFIILFFSTLFAILIIFKTQYINEVYQSVSNNNITNAEPNVILNFAHNNFNGELISSSILLIISFAMTAKYIYSLKDVFKKKSLLYLSTLANNILYLYVIYKIVMLIYQLVRFKLVIDFINFPILSSLFIINIILPLLLALMYIVFVSRLKKLKITSWRINQYENLKKTEEFLKNNPTDLNNIFKNIFGNANVFYEDNKENNATDNITESKSTTQANENLTEEEIKINQERKKLSELNNTTLYEIAQKLYISGYEQMSRDEIIETILKTLNKK
ncbi:Rho termination factor N-terminal domain-containing protein [Mycoplasma sp. 1018B]|uniref:Rho termination factor N-terminal domain-containing protein n=1 Tax=Mycoplasma sp. 1018B TaxID=2967302 RepID=UPI00211CC6DE|nr:Rho termination factor N-terminal domain-containing protein [Mycoplasma sp. 1018B]UUM19125.1 Rho termination factor N-terminal domain-containing protein [Mycoplasma sp. 1018B]